VIQEKHAMRRVALIYNPASGQHSWKRHAAIDKALIVLRAAGVEAKSHETIAPGSAGVLAEEAVRRGCDTIIACGGDGTVHEVLQSLVGTSVALGVVPLGTANALAANLGLRSSPAKVVRKLLTAVPVRISVGQISYQDAAGATRSRYFTVAAGVGADALFLSRLDPTLKRRFGYILYMIEAFRVWATHSFPLFEASLWNAPAPSRGWSRSPSFWRCAFATSAAFSTIWPRRHAAQERAAPGGLQDAQPPALLPLLDRGRLRTPDLFTARLNCSTPSRSSADCATALRRACTPRLMESCWAICRSASRLRPSL
jgi:hypothetical protein